MNIQGITQLTTQERREGWKLLFDGKSIKGWRTYQNKPADSWIAEDETLHCQGKDKAKVRGNLITNDQYENFELSIDWKLTPYGNSGILYLVSEQYKEPYLSGPEYQIIDDKGYPEKLQDWQTTGANYAMDPPKTNAAKPIGEWNHTVIIVNKGHVEHWLNNSKVVEYNLWKEDWKKHKNEGKWKDAPGY
ncbi:MAG TPA: DUF1080 domain-containing protein, partial [Flavisolibacter sp.]|nr:DUF1080 domain-containing protein [Flavisolibacter sp.]